MPGRDLTPSEKIDQDYERMIQFGAALIVVSLLLLAAYVGLTQQEQDPDAEIIMYFNPKAHNDPNYSSEGFKSDSMEPRIIEPKLLKQRHQTFQIEGDEDFSKTEKHKVTETE